MNTPLWFAMVIAATAALVLGAAALFSAWIASVGIAREEGREKLALLLCIGGAVLPPVSWVYLLSGGRRRQVKWIGWLALGAIAAGLVLAVLFFVFRTEITGLLK